MNNEAFRKLLNSNTALGGSKEKSSGGKSTKEIAREAVEEEFRQRKGKRGREDDYLSDDDDDDDDDDQRHQDRKEKRQKEADDEKKAEEDAKEKETKKKKLKKYRDRAKERRQGKTNCDYEDFNGIASQLDEEMTKYLGGDEAHTHLVKGLDRTLAEKVRREEMQIREEPKEQEIDLDVVMEQASLAKARAARKLDADVKTLKISDLQPKRKTPLTTGMLSYLRKIEAKGQPIAATMSEAGTSIPRRTLQFSLDANIHDRQKAWEVPGERMISIPQYERIRAKNSICTTPCTPLNRRFIERIKTAFTSIINKKPKSMKDVNKEKKKPAKEDKQTKALESTVVESDEDIFGGIGDYTPPTRQSNMDNL